MSTVTYSLTQGDSSLIASLTLGVIRQDTGGVVVAAGTPYVQDDAFHWHYTWPDPAPGLVYTVTRTRVDTAGQTISHSWTLYGDLDGQPRYVLPAQAPAILAGMLTLANFAALSASQQAAALARASREIDAAQRYQGRKFNLTQALEFPRIAYGDARNWMAPVPVYPDPFGIPPDSVIWDWDPVQLTGIVPLAVQRACLYQADAIANPARQAALDRVEFGVKSEGVGSVNQSFGDVDLMHVTLCRQARMELQPYLLRTGRLL